MKIGVNLKIDVSKIDKSKLFKGKKGTYLDMTAFIDLDEVGQFGDNGMIVQSVSKEEKQQGIKGEILGNSRVFWRDSESDHVNYNQGYQNQQTIAQREAQQHQQYQQPQREQMNNNYAPSDFDDEIPF